MNKPIFIVPGWTQSTDRWQRLITLLESEGYSVTKLNVPGITSTIDKPLSLEDYIQWLHANLSQQHGKVTLLGHSSGGRIALAYTLSFPQKVNQLILIDSSGVQNNGLISNALKTTKKFIHSLTYKEQRKLDPSNNKTDESLLKKTISNLRSIDLKNHIHKISCPTLLIWGENDKVTPLESGKVINFTIPDSKLFVIYNAKHSPQYTHPEEVFEIIKKNII